MIEMKKILIILCGCLMAACGINSKQDMVDKYDSRIVRLAKLEIYEEFLEEYLDFVGEVGRESVAKEEGVITLFSVQEKENPCRITILEIYASNEAYEYHITTPHFQRYKQGTLHMVKHLELIDGEALVPEMKIKE